MSLSDTPFIEVTGKKADESRGPRAVEAIKRGKVGRRKNEAKR